jgi:hypothetical protein
LGERILTHVAPEIAEAALARALARAEQRAAADRGLTFSVQRDLQRTRLSGYLSAEGAAIVAAALDPLAKPRLAGVGVRDERSAAQRRADALVELAQTSLALDGAPEAQRGRAALTVTVSFDALRQQLGAGQLDTGQALSPAAVRKLGCDALLIPAVLGGKGQVLDLGRAQRTWTGPARRAIILRDRGCVFPGCDRPPAWCDVHHLTHWADGGGTDLCNGALLCGFHHDLVHHAGWDIRIAADGLPELIPPAHVDPQRRPIRNTYHRRP